MPALGLTEPGSRGGESECLTLCPGTKVAQTQLSGGQVSSNWFTVIKGHLTLKGISKCSSSVEPIWRFFTSDWPKTWEQGRTKFIRLIFVVLFPGPRNRFVADRYRGRNYIELNIFISTPGGQTTKSYLALFLGDRDRRYWIPRQSYLTNQRNQRCDTILS